MKNKFVVSFALATLMVGAVARLRCAAQSAATAAQTSPTNAMSGYAAAVRKAVVSGTEATNLTDIEISRLMNESIKTNLAAQLWFRQAMIGNASAKGAKMAQDLRVLETLRAGHAADAIRILEDGLDSDIITLAVQLRAGDETKTFKPTPGPAKSLRWARDYRQKFPYKSGNAATDDQVKNGLSYLDEK